MAASDSVASRRMVEETRRLYASLGSGNLFGDHLLDARQLARPPFKLILDLVRTLNAETRILRDVFNATELSSKKWDRQAKCDFVQKLIDFVANNKQPVIGCLAAKVIAGLEANKTNELLQSLARIAQLRLTSAQRKSSTTQRRQVDVSNSGSGTTSELRRPQTFTRNSAGQASSPATPKVPQDKQTSAAPAEKQQVEQKAQVQVAEEQKPKEEIQPAVAVATKVAPPTASLTVASESDIAKELPRLRSNLRNLCSKLEEMADAEDLLRSSLGETLAGKVDLVADRQRAEQRLAS